MAMNKEIFEEILPLIKLKHTARITLAQVVSDGSISPEHGLEKLLVFLYTYKATDLFESIIILRKHQQEEASQSLIRSLLELNLKFLGLLMLLDDDKNDGSIIMDSFRLMRHKNAREQAEYGFISKEVWEEFDNDCRPLFEKYDPKVIKTLRDHGFCQKGLKDLAREQNKMPLYQLLYRNFSRNVHSDDIMEYLIKIFTPEKKFDDYILSRNDAALAACHNCFLEVVRAFYLVFELGDSEDLKTYKESLAEQESSK